MQSRYCIDNFLIRLFCSPMGTHDDSYAILHLQSLFLTMDDQLAGSICKIINFYFSFDIIEFVKGQFLMKKLTCHMLMRTIKVPKIEKIKNQKSNEKIIVFNEISIVCKNILFFRMKYFFETQ